MKFQSILLFPTQLPFHGKCIFESTKDGWGHKRFRNTYFVNKKIMKQFSNITNPRSTNSMLSHFYVKSLRNCIDIDLLVYTLRLICHVCASYRSGIKRMHIYLHSDFYYLWLCNCPEFPWLAYIILTHLFQSSQ